MDLAEISHFHGQGSQTHGSVYEALLRIFLSAFARLLKVATSFVMFVRWSAWINSSPPGRIFNKFDIRVFFENISKKLKFY